MIKLEQASGGLKLKKHLTPTKKTEIVLQVLRKEDSLASIARQHQVSEQSIYRWQEEFLNAGKQAMSGKVKSTKNHEVEGLKKQLAEQERVIGEYAFANSFLKKKLEN